MMKMVLPKMCYCRLILWLALVASTIFPSAANELFMVKRVMENKTTELQCFFNGPQEQSAGISWILPPSVSEATESHQRWKHKTNTGFIKGHFEYYGHIWESKNSLEVPATNRLPPVLDERWNDFPKVETRVGEVFQPLSSFYTDKFHVSVLAKSEAQIAMHIEESPHTSLAYLITIDPTDAPGVIMLEHCPGGVRKTSEEHKCQLLAKTDSASTTAHLKNGKEWTHFTIHLTQNTHMAHQIVVSDATKDGKILLQYKKHATVHQKAPSYLSARTPKGIGHWRLHKYRVVQHNGKEDGEGFNVMTVTQETSSCLQVYYYLRKGFGNVIVQTKDGAHSMELEPSEDKWKFAILRLPLKPPTDHLHFKVPYGPHLSYVSSIFAMYQPFRVCGDDEFFTTKVLIPQGQDPANTVCQKIDDGQYATLNSGSPVKNSSSKCEFGVKFGTFCNITCGNVMGDMTCRGKVMCDQDSCSCLPGYAATNNWADTCMHEINTTTKITPSTSVDDLAEVTDDEEDEVNKESSDEYLYTLDEAEEHSEKETKIWWILAICVSWVIAIAALYLVIKERPDLVPMCILNPVMRCAGQNQGSDQLINEDA